MKGSDKSRKSLLDGLMQYQINNISTKYEFYISGVSYAGEPKNNTAMYISKKVEYLVERLYSVKECLVFIETGAVVPEELKRENCFIFTDNPQLEYAQFVSKLELEKRQQESKYEYQLTDKGYFIGENVTIGKNAYIEPNVLIGHNVKIGDNARIYYGTVIKNTIIGDNFLANEHALIGSNGFTMTEDECGNKVRIPTLGRVVIKDNVEVGAYDNISCGSGGDTIIEENVKIDALVYLGHDVHVKKNAEVAAGAIIGGFTEVGEYSYIGINAVVRNRIKIGMNAFVGMGATVVKSVDDKNIVAGNPAKKMEKRNRDGI